MNRLVLDASITGAWFLPGESNSYTEALLDAVSSGVEGCVPSLWTYEMGNLVLTAVRQRRVNRVVATQILEVLADLPIVLTAGPDPPRVRQVFETAHDSGLTFYDASYLELAIRETLPLATLDRALRRAARKLGVQLVSA